MRENDAVKMKREKKYSGADTRQDRLVELRGRYKEHVVYQYNFKKNNRSMVGQSSEE